jgi:plasmid stabilization system protein ParE
MRRYLLTDEAKLDLADIKNYLVREAGSRIAKSVMSKIKETLEFLSRTPGAGHVREDLIGEALKFWTIYSYVIVYDHAKRPIEVMRVLHGKRDVSAILDTDSD